MLTRIFSLLKIAWKYADYPWFSFQTGWWHPSMGPVYFKQVWGDGEKPGNYHVTQLFNQPWAFALSRDELQKAVGAEMGLPADDRLVLQKVDKLTRGRQDRCVYAENLALNNGWTMVRSDSMTIGIVATNLKSAQAAVESAWMKKPNNENWEITVNMRSGSGFDSKFLSLHDDKTIKRFLKTGT